MLPTTAPQISHSIHYKLGVNKPTDLEMCLTFTSAQALSTHVAPPVSETGWDLAGDSSALPAIPSCQHSQCRAAERSSPLLGVCSLQMRKIISQFPHIWIRQADSHRVFSPCLSVFQMQLLALPIS